MDDFMSLLFGIMNNNYETAEKVGRTQVGPFTVDTCHTADCGWETAIWKNSNPMIIVARYNTKEEAEQLVAEKGYDVKEDAGRGYRRVVASPIPKRIVEIEEVKMLREKAIVVTCGGGGIPVVENEDGTLEGVAAVIDKDFAAELLAEQIDADALVILTEVEKVAINWGKPDQANLDHMTLAEATRYCEEGHFAPGSMLPKVQAGMKFVTANPGKKAIITSLDKAIEALEGKTGTVITFE